MSEMGYCYQGRLLCCDLCGHAGGCRKVACKYGYCQATAMCAGCRKDAEKRAAQREHCETHCKDASAEFAAQQAEVAAVKATGAYVFCTALGRRDGTVEIGFRNAAGDYKDMIVPTAIYETLTRTSTFDEYAGKAVAA